MICLLCQESNKDSIKLTSQEGKVHHISSLLFKYLRFCFDTEPIDGDLCRNCWHSLVAFHEFYVRIETVFKQINGNIITLDETIIEEEIVEEDEMDYDETGFDNSQSSSKSETNVSGKFTPDLSQIFVNEREADDQAEDVEALNQPINPHSKVAVKSHEIYMKNYTRFVNWQKAKGTDSFAEPVILDYFEEMSNTMQSSTMWSLYSMLKSTILLHQNINISEYSRLIEFLKETNIGYETKKQKLFTNEEMTRFLWEAPDDRYLAIKTWVVMKIIGACKGYEVTSLKTSYVQDNINRITIRIPNETNDYSTTYVIEGQFAEIVRKYIAKRPPNLTTDRFFMKYLNGKCTKTLIGRGSIKQFHKEIAKYLNVPDWQNYNTHSYSGIDKIKCLIKNENIITLDETIIIEESGEEDETDYEDDNQTEDVEAHNQPINPHSCKGAANDTLPQKPNEKYVKNYTRFVNWQKGKGTDSFTEPVLLDYFEEMSNTMQPSTMWSLYSMLKSTILLHQNINISEYSRLLEFLREINIGYAPKKPKLFTDEEITRFLREAPDYRYLSMKAWVVIVLCEVCSGYQMAFFETSDVQDNINGITIRNPKKEKKLKNLKVYVDGQLAEIVRKYMKMRPENTQTNRFFLQYAYGKCTRQPIGKDKMVSFSKEIAKYLKLTDCEDYIERSFRGIKLPQINKVFEPSAMDFTPKVGSLSTSNATTSTQHLRSDLSVAVKEESFDGSFITIEEYSTIIKNETNEDYITTIHENITKSFDIIDDPSDQNIKISEQSQRTKAGWQQYTAQNLPDKNSLANSTSSIETNQRRGQKRKIENVIGPPINLPSSSNSSKKRANTIITTTELSSKIDSSTKNTTSIPSQRKSARKCRRL